MIDTDLSLDKQSNARKYLNRNPLQRFIVSRFLRKVVELVESESPATVLDAGCGEGFLLNELRQRLAGTRLMGLDFSAEALRFPLNRDEGWDKMRGDVTGLPFGDASVEVVTCVEVLEHLHRPEFALAELARVCGRSIVLSVPNEPWFRLTNVARLRYVRDLGNTPGHIQHWSLKSFARLVASHFHIKEVTTSFPWTIVRAER